MKGNVVGVVVIIIAAIVLIVAATRKVVPPPEPPDGPPGPPAPPPGEEEDYGRVQGNITDSATGKPIRGARVYVDGIFHSLTEHTRGYYRTGFVLLGSRPFRIQADNYHTIEQAIVVTQDMMTRDFRLTPLDVADTPWTPGTVVERVWVEPSAVSVGETVRIKVNIQGPWPATYPMDIYGSVMVNGEKLTGNFHITFRNPTLGFDYTPTSAGTYTVRAQDKSATFRATSAISAYYSPCGGVRVPVCTEITIPNVSAFVTPYPGHPGGDYKIGGFGLFNTAHGLVLSSGIPEVEAKVHLAYASKWDTGTVTNSVTVVYATHPGQVRSSRIAVWPTQYSCPPYWDSLQGLAEALARPKTHFYLLLEQYKSNYLAAQAAAGVNFYPHYGRRDIKKEIEFGSPSYLPDYGWAVCPYCGSKVGHTYKTYPHENIPWVEVARKLLLHLIEHHPDKPPTQPLPGQAGSSAAPLNYYTTWEEP